MSKPNMHCGECPYWLAFGEPETTDEQNEAILAHCAECSFDPEAAEEIYKLNNEKERLIFALKETVAWLDYFLTTESDDIYYDEANEARRHAEHLLMELEDTE